MPLQDFVKGDRVAYLVQTNSGLEARCGTVTPIVFAYCKRVKRQVRAAPQKCVFLWDDDSGEVTCIYVERLDFLDGYTRKKRKIENPEKPQCVVCMDADANMAFVHGRTAHLACCEACAKKFNNRSTRLIGSIDEIFGDSTDDDEPVGVLLNNPETLLSRCPVCRQDTDLIVRQF